ncbi:glutaredoxin Grx2 [Schizosaccharomyces japonicus yFS275]|uniref:Glutaredoxin Grx2 n=1 Tax=Schizosaccharomyces japonicus (strain yFS275 / FY16936) TaxID=402676 RepID=B6K7C4_SCHJY|nr:glutaredoxin Grx2 [Schizosaccharomyces japonicus yFS275]EEB09428.1 glutaredoxin Grx2 [Schizosaccharomyces japonicus yFS275]
MTLAKQFVDQALKKNLITVFSKSYCPFCKAAKQTLARYDAPFTAYELDQMKDGPSIQAYLTAKTKQSTVPSIFFKSDFVGGNSDLSKLHSSGQLKTMVEELAEKAEW